MLERQVSDDVLRGLLFTDGKIGVFTRPDDPSLLQNRCYVYHIIGNGTGEWRVPVGGMSAFVDALVARARGSGATIVSEAEALAVHPHGGAHTVEVHYKGHEHRIEARVEASNLTNTPKFGNPTSNVNSGDFMRILSLYGSYAERQIRLAVRYSF